MSHPDYRRATWVCIGLAIANQFTGINVITMFSSDIFKRLEDEFGIEQQLSISAQIYCLGITGFVFACMSNSFVALFNRRALLIGGHIFVMLGFLLLVVFVHF